MTNIPIVLEGIGGWLEPIDERDDVLLANFCAPEELYHPVSVIYYRDDGVVFAPIDWEGPQPQTWADVPSIQWVDKHGRPAVMLLGLPRRFA